MSIASVQHGRVFGIKNDIPDNIYYVEENTILYPAGSNIIIDNVEQRSQRFIPISEPGEGISAITVSADRHVFAVAEKSHRPSIHIYDLHNYRKRRQLFPAESLRAKEFVSLSFSIDSKYLAAQLSEPEWILHYYAWEKGKPIATISASPSPDQPVNQVTINPFDGTEFCVTGKGFVTIYRYSEGNYLCHCWMTMDRVIVGTQEGHIFMVANGEKAQEIVFGHDCAIAALQNMKQGFAAGGVGGYVSLYEFTSPDWSRFELVRKISLPDAEQIITGMTATTSEGTLLVGVDTSRIYKIALSAADLAKSEDLKFEVFSEAFHHASVNGLDLCIRKPLIVTCSPDKSIRIWNYQTGTCELLKYFTEEAHSVSLHPSGLYLLAGFSDKLRLMNVLMDDLRPVREFGIRACKECRFSNGGHSFAAAHGNIIQIFSTWTYDNIENLKGHNGKVKSLHWTPDDGCLVSAGSDGAVYTWNIRQLKRENEHILKTCSYNSAICTPNGKIVYAVGTDKLEITESTVTKEFESNVVLTQVAISNSGRMMFVGTATGAIRAMKYPFGDISEFQEHQAHSGPITKLRVSYDDSYLFSTAEDGCIYMFRIADKDEQRGLQKLKTTLFADEILITKSDLEEKTVLMAELQRNLDELKLEHEYQLRLKDMNFNEKLKEITEKYSQEIEALKISTSVLRTEKEKEDVKHQEQVQNVKARQIQELHEIEIKYNQQLMEEYEKYQQQQDRTSALQDSWQKQMRDFEMSTQRSLAEMQAIAESRLNTKSAEIQRLLDDLRQQEREFEEMMSQNQQDIDTEILAITARYEKKLRAEREEGARLKGENGIMRKKFNTLNKDIEDNKAEIQRMRDNAKKLESIISVLEKDIHSLRKEMSDRDEHIQDKERKVYDLKKRNQELEKYKFVLDFRIKELKEQVEPRENHIAEMSRQIQDINSELKVLNKEQSRLEEQILSHQQKLSDTKAAYVREHEKSQRIMRYIKGYKADLQDVVQYFQDADVLKTMLESMYERFCRGQTGLSNVGIEPPVRSEYMRHHERLKERIVELRTSVDVNAATFRTENVHTMATNQELIAEINTLRKATKFKPQKKAEIKIIAIKAGPRTQASQTAVNRPPPGPLDEAKRFVYSVPPVTRYLVFGSLALSLATQVGMISPRQLLLVYGRVVGRFEIWRLFTAHMLSTGTNILWHTYMLYMNSRSLEETYYVGRRADYLFFVLLMMGSLDVIGIYMGFPYLTESFGMAITFMYSMAKADEVVNFMFGMQFKAMYLPWVLIAFNVVMGGGYFMSLLGIAVGYAYYFLEVTYPQRNNGRKILVTPAFVANLVGPEDNVHGTFGPIPTAARSGGNAQRAAAAAGRHNWGAGHRLGSE
ncbi:hypothetical protein HK105_208296 [Polyrhizophydium stewartii]|uniref:EML-like second beta-propeller domain-containing protein n=1 Tax=Polyrhizophydium stewartii TaxID=2732419 RepID=A0ABR4MYC2_9FUNG